MSIIALPIDRKGLSKIMDNSKSTSQSRITKSVKNIKDVSFTNTSHKTPTSFLTVYLTISSLIDIGLGAPNLNFL